MNQANFPISGAKIATDFRDNLIIDRYDPVFATMRARKCKHLRSSNSEDVVTWNVFRSLRQIDPSVWLPTLSSTAFPRGGPTRHERDATVTLWKNVSPPPSLLSYGDEGESEIDIIIESPAWVWFIEAKLTSDISTKTTMRDERDQVLRNIDVGSYYAGVRPFYFSLLLISPLRSPKGAAAVTRWQDRPTLREALRDHRPDGLENLAGISTITWADLARVLDAARSAPRIHEREYATRALEWLCSLDHLKSAAPADSSVTSVYAVMMQVARTLQAKFGSAPIPLEVLKQEVMAATGCAEGSVLPSDYAYNRINRAKWSGEKPIFLA